MRYEDLSVYQVDNFVRQPGVIVIDIRDIYSYRDGHLQGAKHIDSGVMEKLMRLHMSNPAVLVYGYRGDNSRDMAESLSALGFTNVSHLVGGWEAWEIYHSQLQDDTFYYSDCLVGLPA